jgi:hypothetical protein
MSVVKKVLAIRKLHLPDEICEEILAYMFYDSVERTNNKKRKLNSFIGRYIVRYEDNNAADMICVWGLSFFPYDSFQIQNINCTTCGNFLKNKNKCLNMSCRCIMA